MKKVAYKPKVTKKGKKTKLITGGWTGNVEPKVQGLGLEDIERLGITPEQIATIQAEGMSNITSAGINVAEGASDAATAAGGGMEGGYAAAAKLVGGVGDAMQASDDRPSVAAGAISGAGQGAALGTSILPGWGTAIGAVVGGVAGGVSSKFKQTAFIDATQRQAKEDKLLALNAGKLTNSNYNNTGTGITSFAKDGGIIHYPYQDQDKGIMVNPTMELAKGGELQPISDTAVEVDGDNPNATDGVELEAAFVNDGETIEEGKVYTDEFGLNGKKTSKKNPSFATLHKKLQKSKDPNPRFKDFNSYIDKKSEDLFEAQEDLKEGDTPYANLCRGGKMKKQDGGKIHEGTQLSDVVLNSNKDLDFVQRIGDSKGIKGINNPDGTVSSHSMAAEVDEKGNWYMLPTVVNKEGKLDRLPNPDAAMEYGKKTGERIKMPNAETALWLSSDEGYKKSELAKKGAFKNQLEEGGKIEPKPIYETSKTPGPEYQKHNLEGTSNFYKNALTKKWGEGSLQDYADNAAELTGVDPQEFSAAMLQEGWNPDRFANTGEFTQIDKKTGKPIKGFSPEEGLSSYYAIGLDTAGDYAKEIKAKTGLKPSEFTTTTVQNEQGQDVRPMTGEKDYQKMINSAAGLYKYQSELVGNIAEEEGITLSPEQRQYFNYMGYNTQHNTPYIKDDKGKPGVAGSSVRRMMKDFNTKGYLKETGDNWNKRVQVATKEEKEKGVSYNPYEKDSGDAQLYENASNAYRRIGEIKNAYSKRDRASEPENIAKSSKSQSEWDMEMARREKASKVNGGYTDMNTLSAEHMKAGLTLKKKKKYAFGGYSKERDPLPGWDKVLANKSDEELQAILDKGFSTKDWGIGKFRGNKTATKTATASEDPYDVSRFEDPEEIIETPADAYKREADMKALMGKYGMPDIFTNKDKVIGAQARADSGDMDLVDVSQFADAEEKINSTPPPSGKKINTKGLADTIGTYAPDIAGMLTKLPEVPTSSKVGRTKLEEVDNQEELDRINRSYRGAVKGLEGSAQSGAVEATKSSLFAKKLQGENVSYDKVNKLNTQIRNTQAAINAQERATDTKIMNQQKKDELSKNLKQLEISRDSLTNMANKVMASSSEGKMRDLDERKMKILASMNKGSGTSGRATAGQFKELFGREPTAEEKKAYGMRYGGLMRKTRKRVAA